MNRKWKVGRDTADLIFIMDLFSVTVFRGAENKKRFAGALCGHNEIVRQTLDPHFVREIKTTQLEPAIQDGCGDVSQWNWWCVAKVGKVQPVFVTVRHHRRESASKTDCVFRTWHTPKNPNTLSATLETVVILPWSDSFGALSRNTGRWVSASSPCLWNAPPTVTSSQFEISPSPPSLSPSPLFASLP